MTMTLERVVMTTADGEAREAKTYPDGSYSCPFCSAAVLSPASWADNEANNARIYGQSGAAYTVAEYPRSMRLVWEMRGCPNPACLILLNPVALARVRSERAEREAESARRKRMHERAMADIAESRERRAQLWADLSASAEALGQCVACLRASYWESRPRLVVHRDPSNCPVARKYAR